MKKIGIVILACLSSIAFSQTGPPIEWQNTIGGSNYDEPNCIKQTLDGGYIIVGSSDSPISGEKTDSCIGGADYWVIKLDTYGNIEWQNAIGGNLSDGLNLIQQTSDGGYILAGYSNSNISGDKTENCISGSHDYWVVKLNSSGNIIWQNTIGGNNDDYLNSIQQTSDGGYILGGFSQSGISGDKTENVFTIGYYDYWIIKLNSTGSIVWQNTIGGAGNDILSSIRQTSDGGYIVSGYSDSGISGDKTENSNGDRDIWIIKLNPTGSIVWQNTIGGNAFDMAASISETMDGGYIIGGRSESNISGDKTENSIGGSDFWLLKINALGNIVWENTIGGSANDYLNVAMQTSDGGYIVAGTSLSNISGDKIENALGNADYWIIKTNSTGSLVWQNTIGGTSADYLKDINKTTDGGYILGGHSNSNISADKSENSFGYYDYWVIKLSDCTSYSQDTVITCHSYLWNGNSYYITGVYTDTILNFAGCDSIMTLHLTILNSTYSFDTISTCDSVVWNGNTYTTNGIFTDTISNFIGCDSIMTLNLSILFSTSFDTLSACDSYLWNGTDYTTSGVYLDTIPNLAGCDSIMTLNLTILNSTTSFDTIVACDSYVWNGYTYTITGVYIDTLPNFAGCDSIMTLNLTINPLPTPIISFDGDSTLSTTVFNSYQWYNCISNNSISGEINQSFSPLTDGSYAVIVSNSFGCSDTSDCYVYVDSCHASFYSEADTVTPYLINIWDNSYYPNNIASYSFLWDFGDGNFSTLQFPTHTYDTLGLYFICLTISDGASCYDTFCDSAFARLSGGEFNQVNVINPATVGIEELSEYPEPFILYPNPTSDMVTIKANIEFTNTEIVIHNYVGEIIRTTHDTNTISLENLAAGVYYLKLRFAGGEKVFRVIKL